VLTPDSSEIAIWFVICCNASTNFHLGFPLVSLLASLLAFSHIWEAVWVWMGLVNLSSWGHVQMVQEHVWKENSLHFRHVLWFCQGLSTRADERDVFEFFSGRAGVVIAPSDASRLSAVQKHPGSFRKSFTCFQCPSLVAAKRWFFPFLKS
jgi:hypothetical protein